ncbi:MAG: succinylglutamate desuccinylase/aspartoacylase family protein, partial [Rickettsiales bacterium]|nr:succinylglutamate desuccinylase/aspartoacylase family protein [Rickettsiales bacterium]
MADVLKIAGVSIPRGKRKKIEVPVAKLYDYTEISMPVEVVRGKQDGPILFVSAAIHGDEINGVETIKRLLARRRVGAKMKGTLIAVPIVNVFGFNRNSRYLPDRRDLNRCFPGSETGSLGGQVANI